MINTSGEQEESMAFWIPAFAGFLVMILLALLFGHAHPMASFAAPVIGGFIAGILVSEGTMEGAKAGFTSGIFGAIIASVLILVGGLAFFGISGLAVGIVVDIVIILIFSLSLGILGMIGGAVGGLFSR
ncbi:DUF5518 domain-containing protein [Methanoplanus limicola]|nr:DUF5518 domain-containing protein [Methanoplanus limicola]